jgi:hypothetical protein
MATTITAASPVALAAKLDEICARLSRIEAKLDEALPTGHASAPVDAALLVAIRSSVGPRSFSAKELIAHARVDAALREALLAAHVETAADCGYTLRRLRDHVIGGFVVERDRDHRGEIRRHAGVRWRVQMT